jgi:hypothetical protein
VYGQQQQQQQQQQLQQQHQLHQQHLQHQQQQQQQHPHHLSRTASDSTPPLSSSSRPGSAHQHVQQQHVQPVHQQQQQQHVRRDSEPVDQLVNSPLAAVVDQVVDEKAVGAAIVDDPDKVGNAHYLTSNLVVITNYTGDAQAVVDEHFSRALNYANNEANGAVGGNKGKYHEH